MAVTKAMTGAGVTMTVGGTAIGQIKSVQLGGTKWATDDITNAGSPVAGGGVLKEVLPTILDSGECTVEGVWLYSDAGQQALLTAFNAGSLVAIVVTLPKGEGQATTGTSFSFSGFVTDPPFPDNISFDKGLLFKSVVKINTAITVAYGS
jgi:hypothetical protein